MARIFLMIGVTTGIAIVAACASIGMSKNSGQQPGLITSNKPGVEESELEQHQDVNDAKRPLDELLTASAFTGRELGQIASAFDVWAYRVFPPLLMELSDERPADLLIVGRAYMADGEVRSFGDTLQQGDRTRRAAFINFGADPIVFTVHEHGAEIPVEIEPMEMFVIGSAHKGQQPGHEARDDWRQPGGPPLPLNSCDSGTCDFGYYACCNYGGEGILPSCRCVQSGSPSPGCQNGGECATRCTLTKKEGESYACHVWCDRSECNGNGDGQDGCCSSACCTWNGVDDYIPRCRCVKESDPSPTDCDAGGPEGSYDCGLVQTVPK